MLGNIHSFETFGSVDGPGIRFIVFLSGCSLRCKYCHNPDTWNTESAKKTEASEIIQKALRYKPYWGNSGGITVSGGEPLLQIDFLIELFSLAKKNGIHTCIDTSGAPFTKENSWFEKFNSLMHLTDLLLVDIKHINEKEHILLTGKSGKNNLQLLQYLSEIKKPVWIRHVLVPGITDNDIYLNELRFFLNTLKNIQKIEVLPYHSFGEFKYKNLNIPYPLEGTEAPTKERILNAEKILGIR